MGQPMRMLIVEDEDILAVNLMTYIQRFGWDVRIASTGLQALAAADDFRPELLLLDYLLPDMTGFQILDAIHTHFYRCDCVLMTAHPTDTVLADAEQRGINCILHKPFRLNELDVHLSAATAKLRPSTFPGPSTK